MVKTTKGGRIMNPADAFRKEQRRKEIARNRLERKYTREAVAQRDNPDIIKKQLKDIIQLEDATDGKLNKEQKLKKKVLQAAYDNALKRKQEGGAAATAGASTSLGAATSGTRPEDSRYYHPTLNPTGAPPPGKLPAALVAPAKPAIPLPKPPPLPQGPAPKLPPPPAAPPLPSTPAPTATPSAQPLPPPAEPPPGFPGSQLPTPLPPPPVPPPGWRFPTPAVPQPVARLPPPPAPPPGAQPPQPTQAPQPMEEDVPPGMDSTTSTPAAVAAATVGVTVAPSAAMAPPPPPPPPPGVGVQHTVFAPPQLVPGVLMPPPQLPPPSMPPPPAATGAAATAAAPTTVPKVSATITGESTVVRRPLAHKDKALTSMVPASVMVRRETIKPVRPASARTAAGPPGGKATGGGGGSVVDLGFFGMAPGPRAAVTSAPDPDALVAPAPVRRSLAPGAAPASAAATTAATAPPVSADAQYQEFLATMKELGAL